MTFYDLLSSFDTERWWWAALFVLWESDQPVHDFTPGMVDVVALTSPVLFWSPKAPRAPRAGGPAPAAAAPADVEADDHGLPDSDGLSDGDAQTLAGFSSGSDGDPSEDDDSGGLGDLDALFQEWMDAGDDGDNGGGEGADDGDGSALAGPPSDPPFSESPEPILEGPPCPGAGSSSDPPGPLAVPPGAEALPAVAPVAPPPPPPPPLEGGDRFPREAGRYPTVFAGGSITYYASKADPEFGRFQAVCGNLHHGKLCRLTRTNRGAPGGRKVAQGRPLGLLAVWLEVGQQVDSKEEHEAMIAFLIFEERSRCRAGLITQENGLGLATFERPPRDDGEGLEPEGIA